MSKTEEKVGVKSLFIYIVQHNKHFIGFESRKKIFIMSHIIFFISALSQRRKRKRFGGMLVSRVEKGKV